MTTDAFTRKPVNEFKNNQESIISDSFNLQRIVTRVESNDKRIADAVREFLRPFKAVNDNLDAHIEFCFLHEERLPILPHSPRIIYETAFLKYYQSDNYRFIGARDGGYAYADLSKNRAACCVSKKSIVDSWTIVHHLFFPLWAQMLKNKGLFVMHAAGFVNHGKGFLFPAPSGSGKSVTSLNLISAGYKILSEDTVFLYKENESIKAVGFPEGICLRPEALRLFPNLESIDSMPGSQRKLHVDAEKLYPGCFVDSAVIDALVFPEIIDSKMSNFHLIDKSEAVGRLLGNSLFLLDPTTSKLHFQLLSQMADRIPCFEIEIGSDKEGLLKAMHNIINEI